MLSTSSGCSPCWASWSATSGRRASPAPPPAHASSLLFFGGVILLAGALTWPLGDLASHWLLVALVLQRLVLTLAVPPLLVLGTPVPVIDRLTRPAAVDAGLRVVVRPVPAVAIVTVKLSPDAATLTVGAVNLAAALGLMRPRPHVALVVLASGFVLWAPVLAEFPGAQHLSALGRGGYLIVQSIVPSFLSIVWIFARHPLYPTFTYAGTVVGMKPLLDQELAGFLAKISTIAVLWTVAFVIMARAQAAETTAGKDARSRSCGPTSSARLSGPIAVRGASGRPVRRHPDGGADVDMRAQCATYGCNGQLPCPRASGRPRDERRRRLGQSSSSLTSPARWSPKRPSSPVISWSRSVRAAARLHVPRSPSAALKCVALERRAPYWAEHLRREVRRRATTGSACRVLRRPPLPDARRALPCDGLAALRRDDRAAAPPARRAGRRPAPGRSDRPVGGRAQTGRDASPHHAVGDLGPLVVVPAWDAASPPVSFPSPVPSVDAGVLRVERRTPSLLPEHMAGAYATFLRQQWN